MKVSPCHIFQFPAIDLYTNPFNLTGDFRTKDVRGIQREELHTPQEVLRKELHEAPRKTRSEAGDMGPRDDVNVDKKPVNFKQGIFLLVGDGFEVMIAG